MASTSDELFEAIEAGDVGRVDAMLDADPPLASSRDASGVSALMRAVYRFDKALTDAVKKRVDSLDLFEASAFGDLDRIVNAAHQAHNHGGRLRLAWRARARGWPLREACGRRRCRP